MALRARVWSAGKILLLVGALFGTFLVSAATSMRVALRAREIKVPDFSNRTANEATALAADLGLAIKVDDARRLDPKVPAWQLINVGIGYAMVTLNLPNFNHVDVEGTIEFILRGMK